LGFTIWDLRFSVNSFNLRVLHYDLITFITFTSLYA
jgi:hypothetical protein